MAEFLRSEIVEDWKAFSALEHEWNTLLQNSRADTIFLTWEWIQSWLRVTGESAKSFVVVIRNSRNELCGTAPFYVSQYRLLHSIRYRVLRPVADYATGAECQGWVVHVDRESQVYPLITQTLASANDRWDSIWMPYVPEWNEASSRIASACGEQGLICRTRPAEFGCVVLPDAFESFMGMLTRNKRSELRRQQKAVCSMGRAVISRCRTPPELNRYLDALFCLNHKRWQSRGQDGTFVRKPAEAEFYREFLPIALQRGWLWLYGLEAESEFKAVQVGYVYRGAFHQVQEGFDPTFTPGAGNVLRAKVIEDCIAAGIECYDFMGEMSEHKRRWSAVPRLGRHMFVGNRNVRSRLLFAKEIWPTGRYLRPYRLPSENRLQA